MKRILLTVLVLSLVAISVVAAQSDDFGKAAAVYSFPEDHGLHHHDPEMNENYIEWLYFTGLVEDADGRLWGHQFTLFQALPPEGPAMLAFLYDVALTDIEGERFLHYRGAFPALNQIRDTDDGWQFSSRNVAIAYDEIDDRWRLRFAGEMEDRTNGIEEIPVQIDFELVNDKSDYYLHNEAGLTPIGICDKNRETLDGYTYYYTHPALSTSGTVTMDGASLELGGDTWFDHQWGNFVRCFLAWDWFSLRFDDGSYMMIFALLDQNFQPSELFGMTYIDVDGGVTYWTGEDDFELTPLRTWTDPASGIEYPVEWTLETPAGSFGVRPFFDNQVAPPLVIIPDYWEGVISVHDGGIEGERIGLGYLEVAR